MQVVRKIHSDVTTVFRTTPKQSKEASPKERFERTRAAARSPREIQALLLRRQLSYSAEQGIIRCRAEVVEQGKPCGDGKPEGLDVPP